MTDRIEFTTAAVIRALKPSEGDAPAKLWMEVQARSKCMEFPSITGASPVYIRDHVPHRH